MKQHFLQLYTKEGEALLRDTERVPWDCYPRPQMERDSFLCLNGWWQLSLTHRGRTLSKGRIRVPFPPQALLSGVQQPPPRDAWLCYEREFDAPTEAHQGKRVLLHIGAADRLCTVHLNGHPVGGNDGGYGELCLDITAQLQAQNRLRIEVLDNGLEDYPYGKQRKKRGGMWYTQISGIWQTVWLECVPECYIDRLRISTDSTGADICIEGEHAPKSGTVTLHLPTGDVDFPVRDGAARIAPKDPQLWSPEHPHLYRFTLRAGEDTVRSYFALRTLEIRQHHGRARIFLNGKPYFFHGLLDQGYYSDGLFLPATPEGYEEDILLAKRLGFNTLRKHIKVEPKRFYYDCDRLGMIVFQDMVNNGHYSFWRDTALPTLGFKRRNDRCMHRNSLARENFLQTMEQTVRALSNHPSVCYWTIFNEGWGQFDHAAVYARLRALDSTRVIDSVSGWFLPKKGDAVSDVESPHVYFKQVKLRFGKLPLLLSEFGGYSYKIPAHSFNQKQNYGYRTFRDAASFEDALCALYEKEILPAAREGLCGAIYTQLSDVEDETNGLVTYDRRVVKVNAARMAAIAERLMRESEGKL